MFGLVTKVLQGTFMYAAVSFKNIHVNMPDLKSDKVMEMGQKVARATGHDDAADAM